MEGGRKGEREGGRKGGKEGGGVIGREGGREGWEMEGTWYGCMNRPVQQEVDMLEEEVGLDMAGKSRGKSSMKDMYNLLGIVYIIERERERERERKRDRE